MHPEVQQDTPGRCPKCGMELVLAETLQNQPPITDRGLGVITWKNYLPLMAVLAVITFLALLGTLADYRDHAASLTGFVGYFMTGFFIIFAIFKIADLKGFAAGYSTYDLLAKKFFNYGYIYPFIELGFGLAMLMGLQSTALLLAEIAVMAFSGLGVSLKLLKKEPVQCVCLGTFLKIPLTNVTLFEDFGMAALALFLLVCGG